MIAVLASRRELFRECIVEGEEFGGAWRGVEVGGGGWRVKVGVGGGGGGWWAGVGVGPPPPKFQFSGDPRGPKNLNFFVVGWWCTPTPDFTL